MIMDSSLFISFLTGQSNRPSIVDTMRFIIPSFLLSAGLALAIPGAPAPSGKCETSAKCPGNRSIIWGAPPMHKFYCNLGTHQCEPTLKDGEKCTNRDLCESQFCVNGVCREDNTGKSCTTPSDCRAGGIGWLCSPKTKTCLRADLMRGKTCVMNEQCVTGYCSQDTGRCDHQPGGEFADCSTNADCSSPFVCRKARFLDEKTCQPDNGDLYAPCSAQKKCGKGLMCQNGECVQAPQCTEQGLTCFKNAECCSKKCESTKIPLLYTCAPSS